MNHPNHDVFLHRADVPRSLGRRFIPGMVIMRGFLSLLSPMGAEAMRILRSFPMH